MTLTRPGTPPVAPRRRVWGVVVGIAIVAAVIAWFVFSGIGNALVYYVTPSELLARGTAAVGETVRLGGLVKVGSVRGPGTDLTFVLTDEKHEITVHSSVAPTTSFREGIGAVVEGQLTADGVFEASLVIVKHDENYVAPTNGAIPSQVIVPGG